MGVGALCLLEVGNIIFSRQCLAKARLGFRVRMVASKTQASCYTQASCRMHGGEAGTKTGEWPHRTPELGTEEGCTYHSAAHFRRNV